jgi:hypothetical protein
MSREGLPRTARRRWVKSVFPEYFHVSLWKTPGMASHLEMNCRIQSGFEDFSYTCGYALHDEVDIVLSQ